MFAIRSFGNPLLGRVCTSTNNEKIYYVDYCLLHVSRFIYMLRDSTWRARGQSMQNLTLMCPFALLNTLFLLQGTTMHSLPEFAP